MNTAPIDVVDGGALSTMTKTTLEVQFERAMKHPRDANAALDTALATATQNEEVAEACLYKLPRGEDPVEGPSVRLAEIISATWGNLAVQARVIDIGQKYITAQGVGIDFETGNSVSVEVQRRITYKDGGRFNDDMIGVTGNAAIAIAYRNTVFKLIPAALVQPVYERVKEVAVGSEKNIEKRRASVVNRLRTNLKISTARILAAVGVEEIEDIDADKLETLIGFGTVVKNGEAMIDDVFPKPTASNGAKLNEAIKQKQAEESAAEPDETPAEAASADPAPDGGPSPFEKMIMALAEKAGITDKEASKRAQSYAKKKFGLKNAIAMTDEQVQQVITDIKVVVDANTIK